MINMNDIDPFAEEEWDEIELKLDDIYDVIYGCIMTYYKEQYMNYNLRIKDNTIFLTEKIDEDNDDLICSFNITNDVTVNIIYKLQEYNIELINKKSDDKTKVFFGFRSSFDKYLKSKNDE